MKYVVVTGGVVSGLGKGVTASSIGVLLKACGLRITSIKIDPYLNTDAGTMSPLEHGEVYVLDDGGEVDLDLGNYERFLDIKLTRDNNITTGKIYQSVINKERKGVYLGKTVQVVPHITDEIQEWIERTASIPVDGKEGPADVCVIELGGTIEGHDVSGYNESGIVDAGDIESMPFIEALGQFSYRVGQGNFCLVHVSLIPVLNAVGEQKTKPTQHSVRGLRGLGLAPDILACRSAEALDENVKEKLSQFCHVPADNIVNLHDVSNIWHIPLMLREQKAHDSILKVLNLQSVGSVPHMPKLDEWIERARKCDSLDVPVKIAMVGKYTGLSDAYLSVLKALLHASVACNRKLVVNWVPSPDLEETTCDENPEAYHSAWNLLKGAEGILVPGGFGDRGVQGKILAAKYARETKIPFLGICLGMQIAVIEFARSVMKLPGANSTEFDPDTRSPCVIFMPESQLVPVVVLSILPFDLYSCVYFFISFHDRTMIPIQGSKTHMGATMRLGSRRTYFQTSNCKAAKLYGGNAGYVDERHRHRYEVNPEMVPQFEKAGLVFVGKDETQKRMEIIELQNHPFYVGVQFHPEFKSRPGKPSALFLGLIAASTGQLSTFLQSNSKGYKPTQKRVPSHSNSKLCQNGHINGHMKKPLKPLVNGNGNYYVNGNGLHV